MGKGRWKYIDSYGMDRGRLRKLLHRRQGGRCAICREPFGKKFLTSRYVNVDHIWPQSHGGPSVLWNVQLTCSDCNLEKADRCTYPLCKKCRPEEGT